MFPSNLHKNILQLDKQISLLENECKNLDVKKRRKTINSKLPRNKCSKILDSCAKSPVQKVGLKKSFNSSNKFKKISPPITSRVHSTGSLLSNCSKQCSYNVNQHGLAENPHICLCQMVVNAKKHFNLENHQTDLQKLSCNEGSMVEDGKNIQKNFIENCNKKNSDCILHREVLLSNPGSTIEVTVTKKHNDDNQRENFSFKNSLNSEKSSRHHLESNGSITAEQNWSEILRARTLKPLKQREENCITCENSDKFYKENGVIPVQHFFGLTDNKFKDKAFPEKHYSANNIKKKDDLTPPVKLIQSPGLKKSLPIIKSNIDGEFLKKNVADNSDCTKDKTSPIKLFQLLMNEMEKTSNCEEFKEKLLNDIKTKENDNIIQKTVTENNSHGAKGFTNNKNDLFQTIRKLCENLIVEKDTMFKELEIKNSMIRTMKKREEEYTTVITSLQNNIEKSKSDIPNSINAVKELASLKDKLVEQMKISEVLKKSHIQLKEILDKCALENDRLKTEIQIFKLESQKHEVLMAGKEAEIKHYREEIRNFQTQIAEHLASLKSSSQSIDLKQMMDAIIQQSQILSKTDLDSILLEGGDLKDSQKQNKLIHSSPTSSKTSDVNSSWKQISSIRGNEQVFLNESNDNEFLKAFIENLSSDSGSAKINGKTSTTQIKKKSSSFTSCLSLNEDEIENEMPSVMDKKPAKVESVKLKKTKSEGVTNLSSEKIKISIDELLKGMKLKWSKEVYDVSKKNNSIDDLLSCSQMSKSAK